MAKVSLGLKSLLLPHLPSERLTEFWFIFCWYFGSIFPLMPIVATQNSAVSGLVIGQGTVCICVWKTFSFVLFSIMMALVLSSPPAFSLRILPLCTAPLLFVGNFTWTWGNVKYYLFSCIFDYFSLCFLEIWWSAFFANCISLNFISECYKIGKGIYNAEAIRKRQIDYKKCFLIS